MHCYSMSKREIFSQTYGENKRPKLDPTVSDHNFPISNNANGSKNWGDDIDDEVLLLASQACEADWNTNETPLPEYSICMRPQSTSTQNWPPHPKSFSFKVPNTSNIKQQSYSSNSFGSRTIDQPTTNHGAYKEKTFEELQKEIVNLHEEILKLKSDNNEINTKFLIKEGEVKILRDNLTQHQKSVENLKQNQIHAQEEIQKEFNEKLTVICSENEDLKAQLDSKNLEVISLKKRHALNSSNLKVMQVTLSTNESLPKNIYRTNDVKKAVMNDSSVQTDNKKKRIRLNKLIRIGENKLVEILPLILEEQVDEQCDLLEHNRKLQKEIDFAQSKCNIFNTVHRFPLASTTTHPVLKPKLSLACLSQDLSYIAKIRQNDFSEEVQYKYSNIFKTIKLFLQDVVLQLEILTQRMTVAFRKESDKEYINATSTFVAIDKGDLFRAKTLHKDEQAILARRATAVLGFFLESSKIANFFLKIEEKTIGNAIDNTISIHDMLCKICDLIDSCSCAILYSGLLVSIIFVIENMWQLSPEAYAKTIKIIKSIIISRPLYTVIYYIVILLRKMSRSGEFLKSICNKSHSNKLKLDYDQGVLLVKRDTCVLQLLSKQTECALKCMAKQELTDRLATTTQNMITFYNNVAELNTAWTNKSDNKAKCDCSLVIRQVIVYALQLCTANLKLNNSVLSQSSKSELEALCRCGLTLVYQWVLSDVDFISHLGYHEGHYQNFVAACDDMKSELGFDEMQINMLAGLMSTLPVVAEDVQVPSAAASDIWAETLENLV